jgi:hypothetical protein
MGGEQESVAALHTPADPANIPYDVESQGVATRVNQESNPQISGPLWPLPQVAGSGPRHPLKRVPVLRWRLSASGVTRRTRVEPALVCG